MIDVLRAYLARRSVSIDARAIGWGVWLALVMLVRGVVLWLYPGWRPISGPLLGLALIAAFMVGRYAGWRACWQESIKFIDKTKAGESNAD